MADEIPLYDAKANLSALVRQVSEGRTVVITVHGEPMAELRPVERAASEPSLEERLKDFETRGIITGASVRPSDPSALPIGARKSGALKRFLDDRE
ncbi:MAG: type II toxin-antitoxin system prevent-host-death family antitoxin [Gemmatimonadaceae bacterium]